MNTVSPPMYEWKDIPLNKIQKAVFKLQKRIYLASLRDDVRAVRKLQRLLMNSQATKCLAASMVTQDKGFGNGKKISDQALQVLVKLALEPEWEAKFSPNCYGFRAGGECHEAIAAIYNGIGQVPKYVLVAEIAQSSYRQHHNALLKKLATSPSLRRQIKAWLKAGVMDAEREGTRQGGIVSPLLANIALHGLETAIANALSRRGGKTKEGRYSTVIRYGSSFLVLDEDIAVILKAKEIAEKWLSRIGLELLPGITRVAHTLNEYEGNVGFDFLGCNFRQYKVGRLHSKRGYKTFIKPSKEEIKRHMVRVDDVLRKHKSSSTQSALIRALNSVICGWKSYYYTSVDREAFDYLDSVLYQKLFAWAKRRHPKKNNTEIVSKYWLVNEGGGWKFATKEINNRYVLVKYRNKPIVVKGGYWRKGCDE